MEPTRGLEPLTARLQVGCATSCATSASGDQDVRPDVRPDVGKAYGVGVGGRSPGVTVSGCPVRTTLTSHLRTRVRRIGGHSPNVSRDGYGPLDPSADHGEAVRHEE